MKKATHAAVPGNVDEYLARVPEPARTTLKRIRATIRAAVPTAATEAISYGIPTFKYEGGLVAFAAFSKHCSLFPMSLAVMRSFRKELESYETSRGTIRFALDKPLPATLLRKIVKARLKEKAARRAR